MRNHTSIYFSASFFVCAVLSHDADAQHSMIYVPSSTTSAVGAQSTLDDFTDQDVLIHTPSATTTPARKMISSAQWNALLGDENANSLFFEFILDEVNALAILRGEESPDTITGYDLFFSAQEIFGESFEDPITDGSLWRLAGPEEDEPVEVFLDEEELQIGLGTTSGLDIDAATLAEDGTLFLSFKNDELIFGDATLLENGAVVAFFDTAITYDDDDNIDAIAAGSAQIVLSEAEVDALVGNAALLDGDSLAIATCGNVSALDIDPAGGVFMDANGVSWPNLLFASSNAGPRILSTAGAGSIAQLNGQVLGIASGPDGAPLGLGLEGAAPAALIVIAEQSAPLVLDLDEGALTPSALSDVLHLGNGTPSGSALLLIALGSSAPGTIYPGVNLGDLYVFPGFYTTPLAFPGVALPLDADGRVTLPLAIPPTTSVDLNVLIQFVDLTKVELSAPIVIAYDADGE